MRFEWDAAKSTANRRKHGVSFSQANRAFEDPSRVILEDPRHSGAENRYVCLGVVEDSVLTVIFTHRQDSIRIITGGFVPVGTGGKEGQSMSKRTRDKDSYTDAPADVEAILDRSRRIADPVWLPHPAELARVRENKRVTINITRRSYEVFSHYAEEHHIPYQAMIRDVLDAYAAGLEDAPRSG